ncbi:DUF4160 domain-containing protein [Salinarimonas sp. NSM]|uniref:DUF4160 domain-containing protein n=1 Tax=Salinarimonas sp. NSM TaxID=3458003 RepID=UPI0040352A91
MPVVSRVDGYRFLIFVNDHRPAHVHAYGGGGNAVFLLNCPDGPPKLRESVRLGPKQLRYLLRTISLNLAGLCDHWRQIHDTF